MNPLIGFPLHHPEQAPLHHLERVGLQVGEDEEQPIFWRRQGAVLVHGKPTSGPRLPIHPPRRHPGVERGLEGRDQLLKLVKRYTREIQELHRAGLQLGKPYTSHGSCLLSLSCDIRGASYQKESGINSSDLLEATVQDNVIVLKPKDVVDRAHARQQLIEVMDRVHAKLPPSTQDPKEEEEEIAREIKAYRQEHAQRRR